MGKRLDSTVLRRSASEMSSSVIALVLSIIVGGVIVSLLGVNPITVYASLFKGGFGSTVALVGTLNRMAPILLAGLSISIGNSAGIFNMGFDGQFIFGTMCAAFVGYAVQGLPAIIHLPLTMLAGMLGAMLWALVPIYLLANRSVDLIFSCIMLNYIAMYLTDYLATQFPNYSPTAGGTPKIAATAILPFLINNGVVKISVTVLIAILFVVLAFIILSKMRIGYEMKAVGQNRIAARSAGINVTSRMYMGMMFSGAIAGISASLEVMGSTYRLVQNYAPGYMAMGIAVAMLGKSKPVVIMIAAFLFAGMKNGTPLMQLNTGVTAQFVLAVQGLIIIFIGSDQLIKYIANNMKERRKLKNG